MIYVYLDTHVDFINSRYGGWTVARGSEEYLERVMGKSKNLISWYNNKGYHALPSYTNALNNAILRARVNSSQMKGNLGSSDECIECDYGITTFAEPMVLRGGVGSQSVLEVISSYGIALIAMIAFSFVPASSIIYLIQERRAEEKQVRVQIKVWLQSSVYNIVKMILKLLVTLSFCQFLGTNNGRCIKIHLLDLCFHLGSLHLRCIYHSSRTNNIWYADFEVFH